MTPRLRRNHAEVLTVGTIDFEIPAKSPQPTVVSATLPLSMVSGRMQDTVEIIAFGAMTRALGTGVRLIHYRDGVPIAALTEAAGTYSWALPRVSTLEDLAALPANSTVAWGWEGAFNPHLPLEGQASWQFVRSGETTARPPPLPWSPNYTRPNFTEPWYPGPRLRLQPNDELSVECTYRPNVPAVIRGGYQRNRELCLAFITASPAGVLGRQQGLVRKSPSAWRSGEIAQASIDWLTGEVATTASRGPQGHLRTCGDIDADGVQDDAFDCSANVRRLPVHPQVVPCMEDPCTAVECCTRLPAGASTG